MTANMRLSATLCMALSLLLGGCNVTTDEPLFSLADAANVKLSTGYYATGTDVAYIRVFAGRLVINATAAHSMPQDAIVVDLGDGLNVLQYGSIDQAKRTYVLFRYSPDSKSIFTAVYDCSKMSSAFGSRGIGIAVQRDGYCRMTGATKERFIDMQRAIARLIPDKDWSEHFRAMDAVEGSARFDKLSRTKN